MDRVERIAKIVTAIMVCVIIFVAIIAVMDSDDTEDVVNPVEVEMPEPKKPYDYYSFIHDTSLNSGLDIEYKDLIGRWNTQEDGLGGFTLTDDFKVFIHAYNDDNNSWINTKVPGNYTLDKDKLTIILYGDKTELEVVRFTQNKIVLMNQENFTFPITYPDSFAVWTRRDSPFE